MSTLYILLQIKHFTVKHMRKYTKCIPTQGYCRCKAKTDSGSTFTPLKLLTRRSKIVMSLNLIHIFIPYFPWHLSSIQHCWPSSLPEKCFTLAFTKPYSPGPSFSTFLQRLVSYHPTIKCWSFSRFIPGTLFFHTLLSLFKHWHLHPWLQLPSERQRFRSPAQTTLSSRLMQPVIYSTSLLRCFKSL